MKFFPRRGTFLRFAVGGTAPRMFGEEHLGKLRKHVAARPLLATSDEIEVGWVAGTSVLDTTFDRVKNIVGDTLHFALRVDTDRLPAALLKAYYEADLAAILADDLSGVASAVQKRAAKSSAYNRLKREANDGRFRRRKCTPVLWDRAVNEVLFGATSTSLVNRFSELFTRTFGHPLKLLGSEYHAKQTAALLKQPAFADTTPSFVPGARGESAWARDEGVADFLIDLGTDPLPLNDGSRVTPMPTRSPSLDGLRKAIGNGIFAREAPTQRADAPQAVPGVPHSGRSSGSLETVAAEERASDVGERDVFETDFDLPQMEVEERSGSEAVAIETVDADLEERIDSSCEADAETEPSSGELLLLDDADEEPAQAEDRSSENLGDPEADEVFDVADIDVELEVEVEEAEDEDEYEDEDLAADDPRGVSGAEIDEEEEQDAIAHAGVDQPVSWGIVPALLLLPTVVLALVGGLIGAGLLQNMWGYQQLQKPAASLAHSVARLLDLGIGDP